MLSARNIAQAILGIVIMVSHLFWLDHRTCYYIKTERVPWLASYRVNCILCRLSILAVNKHIYVEVICIASLKLRSIGSLQVIH